MIKHIFLKAVLIAFFLIMGVVLIKPSQSFSQSTPAEAEALTAVFIQNTSDCTDDYDGCIFDCVFDESQEPETACVNACTSVYGNCMENVNSE